MSLTFGFTGLGVFNSALSALSSAAPAATSVVRDVVKTDSLVSFTQGGRVEPIVIVDKALLATGEILTDVMYSLSSIFTGYYLQAISYVADIDGVSPLSILDQFNPNRDPVDHILGRASMESHSYDHRLPNYDEVTTRWAPALEAEGKESISLGRDGVRDLDKDASVLSVGRIVNVTIRKNAQTLQVPVSIRLMANMTDSETMAHILSVGSIDNSFKERIHGWRSGRLDFWNDLVLANDIITRHRKNLIKDKSGVLEEIMRRRAKNASMTALTGNMSVATASNMVVVDKATMQAVEGQVGGEFSRYEFRERVFNETYLMIMAVIDNDHRTVTFYTRGIRLPTSLQFSDLKRANKGSGPDIFSIYKALEQGAAVRF